MAGSLSSPNLVKDVYTKLVFYNSSDGKFYRDNGSDDVEVLPDLIDGNILKHQTGSTVSSGDLFQILNNSTEVFSVDYAGVLKFKTQGSAPTAVTGGLYFDGTSIYLGQSS